MCDLYSCYMNKRIPLFLGAAIVSLTPNLVFAAWACGIDDSLLPQVYALEIVDGKLNAFVGPPTREEDWSLTANQVELGANGDWTTLARSALPTPASSGSAGPCMSPPPDKKWLEENKDRVERFPDFEQNISVCTTGSKKRWGGISFYGGEGSWGVGGIVEEDMQTGATRYYRSGLLSDYSTSHLEYFGGHLWIGTASHGECGTGMGIGVLSGYFANDTLYADWTLGAGTCGFLVSEMVVHSDSLWIATELGLSKVTLSGSSARFKKFDWTNYVPTGDDNNPMREVTCDELYEGLFQSQELAAAPPNDDGYPYGVLWGRISKLRPNFAWQYVRKLNGLEPLRKNLESE